ncbi:MAG: hypothetical protein MR428_03410 [Mesosutterella sp.]|nr:hypothetical protein [Mesosutterella sp.]
MGSSGFNWQGWIGAAILIGLLFVLVASLRQSAARVDAGRGDLAPWRGGMTGLLLGFLALVVLMAFQNLVLLTVIVSTLWRPIVEIPGGSALFFRYVVPAAASFALYSAAVALLVWCRRTWVPRAAALLLWAAGPAAAIPSFALYGVQPGLIDFGIPSAVAFAGTFFLFFSRHVKTLYCAGGSRP